MVLIRVAAYFIISDDFFHSELVIQAVKVITQMGTAVTRAIQGLSQRTWTVICFIVTPEMYNVDIMVFPRVRVCAALRNIELTE